MKTLQPTWVKWLDSVGHQGWFVLEQAEEKEPVVCESLGWLVYKDNKKLVLAISASEEMRNVSAPLVIPMGCILEIRHPKVK